MSEIVQKQVKSKERTRDHGEVFTAEREVNAMLDLVKSETERIDSRFLEPACGDGNFLAEILRRKLAIVKNRYQKSPTDYEKNAALAITSIYGIDILLDNVADCRERLFRIFDEAYTLHCKKDVSDDCREAIRFILSRNILCGDALTLKTVDGTPIVFSEWSLVNGGMLQRRDFRLDQMLEGHNFDMRMLAMMHGWEYNEEIKAYIPRPIKEFPLIHYRSVHKHDS